MFDNYLKPRKRFNSNPNKASPKLRSGKKKGFTTKVQNIAKYRNYNLIDDKENHPTTFESKKFKKKTKLRLDSILGPDRLNLNQTLYSDKKINSFRRVNDSASTGKHANISGCKNQSRNLKLDSKSYQSIHNNKCGFNSVDHLKRLGKNTTDLSNLKSILEQSTKKAKQFNHQADLMKSKTLIPSLNLEKVIDETSTSKNKKKKSKFESKSAKVVLRSKPTKRPKKLKGEENINLSPRENTKTSLHKPDIDGKNPKSPSKLRHTTNFPFFDGIRTSKSNIKHNRKYPQSCRNMQSSSYKYMNFGTLSTKKRQEIQPLLQLKTQKMPHEYDFNLFDEQNSSTSAILKELNFCKTFISGKMNHERSESEGGEFQEKNRSKKYSLPQRMKRKCNTSLIGLNVLKGKNLHTLSNLPSQKQSVKKLLKQRMSLQNSSKHDSKSTEKVITKKGELFKDAQSRSPSSCSQKLKVWEQLSSLKFTNKLKKKNNFLAQKIEECQDEIKKLQKYKFENAISINSLQSRNFHLSIKVKTLQSENSSLQVETQKLKNDKSEALEECQIQKETIKMLECRINEMERQGEHQISNPLNSLPKFDNITPIDSSRSDPEKFNLMEFENDMLKTYISSQKQEYEAREKDLLNEIVSYSKF